MFGFVLDLLFNRVIDEDGEVTFTSKMEGILYLILLKLHSICQCKGTENEWTFYDSRLLEEQVEEKQKGIGFVAERCTSALHL